METVPRHASDDTLPVTNSAHAGKHHTPKKSRRGFKSTNGFARKLLTFFKETWMSFLCLVIMGAVTGGVSQSLSV